ncbi:hypothetical protein M5K25_016458 [Dendrobium thyrsiflorum]|uniref:DUF4283 domain-containing protein n=1 Tax=Dendrobium thyrsiflorum TaxID=117978 RepID=A0ABD0UK55_DENTH
MAWPKRENFTYVPILLKIHDLPLACWNFEGISRNASKIGIPFAVDALTVQKTRLTFARVCVQISSSTIYPDQIPISMVGEVFNLRIQYEWRLSPCEFCSSLVHYSSLCPSKPSTTTTDVPTNRGRSFSRTTRNRQLSASPHSQSTRLHNKPTPGASSTSVNNVDVSVSTNPSPVISPPTNPPAITSLSPKSTIISSSPNPTIVSPSCSDHCPIVLQSGYTQPTHHRFLFKNFCAKIDSYWESLISIFGSPCIGNFILSPRPRVRGSWLFHRYVSPWKPPPSGNVCATTCNVRNYFQFRITSNYPISLHWDHWCNGVCISELPLSQPLLDLFSPNAQLKELIIGNNLSMPATAHCSLANIITAIQIHDSSSCCLMWKQRDDGCFNDFVSEFYKNEAPCSWYRLDQHKHYCFAFFYFLLDVFG